MVLQNNRAWKTDLPYCVDMLPRKTLLNFCVGFVGLSFLRLFLFAMNAVAFQTNDHDKLLVQIKALLVFDASTV